MDMLKTGAFLGIFALVFFQPLSQQSCVAEQGQEKERSAVSVETAFGPACEKLLLREIKKAQKEISVAIYSITRRSITGALVSATERGVKVHVKYDSKSTEWRGMKQAIGYLTKRNVRCTAIEMKGEYAKMHHKFAVIDRKCVLTGSYNFTTSGSISNYENLVLIKSPEIAGKFAGEFDAIRNR